MRKLKFVLPLMVFFALTIFVSSCSDDFTEEDALLLQGDLLDQKLRSESELATALAQLQAQTALSLADKQREIEQLKLTLQFQNDSAKAVLEAQLANLAAQMQASMDSAAAAQAALAAQNMAAQRAQIDSLRAAYEAALATQATAQAAEIATALTNLQSQLDATYATLLAQLEQQAAVNAQAHAVELANLRGQMETMAREQQAELVAALAVIQAELASMAAEQAAAIDSLRALYQAELSEQAREHEAEMAAMIANLMAQLDSMAAAQAGQIAQEMQLLLDSLARIGGIINYSVNVVPAGNASFGAGASNTKTDVAGIRVIASQNGVTYETTTDAGGIAHFPNMRVGNVAVTVLGSEVDHTDLRFVADLGTSVTGAGIDYSKITRNAGTRVALFPVGDSPLAATLNGQITWEQDLTNDEREVAPVGLPILARLNANNTAFRARYFNTSANGVNGLELGGTVVSMAYDPAVSRGAVVGTDGTYSITGAPASLDGLELELVVNDFGADQTLLLDELNGRDFPRTTAAAAATGKVANVRAFFSTTAATPTVVPTVAAAFVMVPAPANVFVPGTNAGANTGGAAIGGGASAQGVVGPLSGGIQTISVTNTGSGYTVAPNVTVQAPETIGGVQATAMATINANGEIQNIVVTNPGSGYQGNNYDVTIIAATVNATAVASVTYSVTNVIQGAPFDATAASPAAFGNAGVYTLTSVAPTVTINGGNGGNPDAQVTANMTTAVYGATVTAGGTGYTSAPQVSISQPGGQGTGAQGVANLRKQVSTITNRTLPGPPVVPVVRSGFYSAAPVVTFNLPGGATRAQGTAVLGTTGRVDSDPNANVGANQWWAPGVYYATDDQLTQRRPRLQDSVALAGGVNNGVTVFAGSGLGNQLNPGATFSVSARRMGWITDNGGTGFDVTVSFAIQDLFPTVTSTNDVGGAVTTFDREVRVSGIVVAAQGTGYDAANLPVVNINIATLLGPSGSFFDVDGNANVAGAGYEEVVVASGNFRLIQNSGTDPLHFAYRSQANVVTALIVERQVASITVTTPGSYALLDAITFTLANPLAPAPAVLLGGAFETGNEGTGNAATPNVFRINTTNFVESVTITQIGSDYNPASLPTIEFIGGSGTGATATLVLAQGVAGGNIVDGSFGYTQAAVITLTGGTIVVGSPARVVPTLVYGNGRVTSAQILNPGSGIMAPNGTLRGTIQNQAAIGGHGAQIAGNAGIAEFTFTVTGGQLSAVAINKLGSWANPTFPITSTNFVIEVAAHDGTNFALGTASNTNANIRAAADATNANLPIMGVVDVNVLSGGSGYTSKPSASFAASLVLLGTTVPQLPRNAAGSVVVVAGAVTDINLTSSGVYATTGGNAGPIAVTFTSATTAIVPGAPAVPGTFVGSQAYISLTVDPQTGRVAGANIITVGAGYDTIPALVVYSAIPGVGSGAVVVVTGVSAIITNTNPNTGGSLTGVVRVNNGGSGYFGRNFPVNGTGVAFYGTNNSPMVMVVSGGTHAKDIYLGTGVRTITN